MADLAHEIVEVQYMCICGMIVAGCLLVFLILMCVFDYMDKRKRKKIWK